MKARIAIAAAILVGYGLLSALVAAPDVAGAGPLTREGCLAGYVDRLLLPGKLYGKTFDPEGLLSMVPAVVTAMLGMFTGNSVRRQDLSGGRKASWMIAAVVALLVAGVGFQRVVACEQIAVVEYVRMCRGCLFAGDVRPVLLLRSTSGDGAAGRSSSASWDSTRSRSIWPSVSWASGAYPISSSGAWRRNARRHLPPWSTVPAMWPSAGCFSISFTERTSF